jgi:hypothetical protein
MGHSQKIKILVLQMESWRNDSGGGNTTNNLFKGMNAEFAHVYCSSELPDNDVCAHYFQMTNFSAIKSFFNRKPHGSVLNLHDISQENYKKDKQEKSKISFLKLLRMRNIFLLAKSLAWRYSVWKTIELEKFVLDFDPDVIFAPCYGFPFQLALTRHVSKITNKKIITYSGDDNYSLKQFSFSPFFWINRFWNRHCLRKTYPFYDSFYSMSEDEIEELSPTIGKKMKILRKGVEVTPEFKRRNVHKPIKMIYAGGIYLNRWKTLGEIVKILKKINADSIKIQLDIYSQDNLSAKEKIILHDGRSSVFHGLVDKAELDLLYRSSDIALHCESFDLRQRMATRLSFSTKIVDGLASGCAIIAIASDEQTGLKYLKSEDAALCVSKINDLECALVDIVNNPSEIVVWAEKARKCAIKHHDIRIIQKELYDDFYRLSVEGRSKS